MIRRIGLGLVVTAMVTWPRCRRGSAAGPAGAAPAPAGGGPSTHLSGNGPSGVRAAARHVHPAVAGSGQHAVVPGPWSIASLPTVSTDNWLNGDSCATSSFCVAVGGTNPGSTDQTLIEQWDGAAWSVVPSPNTSTTADDSLAGVSCVTTSFCVAVGYNDDNVGDNDQTLIEEWNGTAWSIVSEPQHVPDRRERPLQRELHQHHLLRSGRRGLQQRRARPWPWAGTAPPGRSRPRPTLRRPTPTSTP